MHRILVFAPLLTPPIDQGLYHLRRGSERPQQVPPKYEKSKKYFQRTPLYQYLTEHGDLSRATNHARQLLALAEQTPEDLHSYTHIHELLIYLDHLCQC